MEKYYIYEINGVEIESKEPFGEVLREAKRLQAIDGGEIHRATVQGADIEWRVLDRGYFKLMK